jgi:hypothetical protein
MTAITFSTAGTRETESQLWSTGTSSQPTNSRRSCRSFSQNCINFVIVAVLGGTDLQGKSVLPGF